MPCQVSVVGSLNVDLVVNVTDFPNPGETIIGSRFAMYSGGKGLNQAIAAARAGATVEMFGAVGRDNNGTFLLKVLDDEGIKRDQVKVRNSASGTALIEVNASGENRIVVVPGANSEVTSQDFHLERPNGTSILLGQHETPMDVLETYFTHAKGAGYFTILNPAPYKMPSDRLLSVIDLIVPNESEAEKLSSLPINSVADAHMAAEAILKLGPNAVIITLGSQGSFYLDAQKHFLQPALKVTPVDTTAAGDTYCGYLAAQLSLGSDPISAMKWASTAASLSTLATGAVPSIPFTKDVSLRL